MISITSVKINGKTALGVKVDLPDSPPLVLILAEKGFVCCGFLSIEAAEKVGATAAMVSGVKTFEDALNAEVKATTSKAGSLGVQTGMKGAEALKLMH
jgi:uncharacterized protein YunC (DUF1805 family)